MHVHDQRFRITSPHFFPMMMLLTLAALTASSCDDANTSTPYQGADEETFLFDREFDAADPAHETADLSETTTEATTEAASDGDADTSIESPEESALSEDGDAPDDATESTTEEPLLPPADPSSAGPYGVRTSSYALDLSATWPDTVLQLSIYLPDAPGPFPVVVFTHGFQLDPSFYTTYGDHLASWGYAAILPEMPGGIFDSRSHVEMKSYLIALNDWITQVGADLQSPLAGKADPDSLAMAGHSMGGKLSFLVATEDARVKGLFGVDPVDSAGGPVAVDPKKYPSVTPELMGDIQIPFVALGETVNGTGGVGGQSCAPAADNFQQYYQNAVSPALQIDILGADHMMFINNRDCGWQCNLCSRGSADPTLTRILTFKYLVSYLQVFIKGQDAWRFYLTGDGVALDARSGLVTYELKNGF